MPPISELILGTILVVVCVFNVVYPIIEIRKYGARNRMFTICCMFIYLIATAGNLVSLWVDSSQDVLNGTSIFLTVQNAGYTVNIVFFVAAIGGVVGLSLIKYDKILPHDLDDRAYFWKSRIVFTFHVLISIFAIITMAIASQTSDYNYGTEFDYGNYAILTFLLWSNTCEIVVNFLFLKALLLIRMNAASSMKLLESSSTNNLGLWHLIKCVQSGSVFLGLLLTCYLIQYFVVTPNTDLGNCTDLIGSVLLGLYATTLILQKKFISIIFKNA